MSFVYSVFQFGYGGVPRTNCAPVSPPRPASESVAVYVRRRTCSGRAGQAAASAAKVAWKTRGLPAGSLPVDVTAGVAMVLAPVGASLPPHAARPRRAVNMRSRRIPSLRESAYLAGPTDGCSASERRTARSLGASVPKVNSCSTEKQAPGIKAAPFRHRGNGSGRAIRASTRRSRQGDQAGPQLRDPRHLEA